MNVLIKSFSSTCANEYNHLKTGFISHLVGSNTTTVSLDNILGIFSTKPPPVICANAITLPVFNAGFKHFTYIFVGVNNVSPIVLVSSNGYLSEYFNPALLIKNLTSENPFDYIN